jgi:hypothetical protein
MKNYPNLPPGATPDDVPFLSRNAVHGIIGQIVQHALRDDCGHQIPQPDCFACGMNHALLGLVAAMRLPE